MAPELFKQIWTINGFYKEKICQPLVYVWMTGKTKELYRKVLDILDLKQPDILVTDYEAAVIRAYRDKYGEDFKVFFYIAILENNSKILRYKAVTSIIPNAFGAM